MARWLLVRFLQRCFRPSLPPRGGHYVDEQNFAKREVNNAATLYEDNYAPVQYYEEVSAGRWALVLLAANTKRSFGG